MTSSPLARRADRAVSRRRVLQLGALGLAGVGGGAIATTLLGSPGSGSGAVGLEAVEAAEAARRRTGRVVTRQLRAAPSTVDLGGRTVQTWTYDGVLPGPEIRVTAGDELRVRLVNDLPDPTTVHWHGLALRNDMDGVPGLTQEPVQSNGEFDYAFVVPHPGTYFFHPHVGVQLDTGLYAPLVVEDPDEQGQYDEDVVLVLDDWTHGWGDDPEQILDRMRRDGMPMGGMGHGRMSTGDVAYPGHLVGGRLPQAPFTVESAPGRRIRLRIVNAGSETAYRFAVGGHRLTVTHTDGFAVQPVEVDTLVLGMGERYDVVVTAGDGAFPIVAVPEGKDDPHGLAVLRTASGPVPSPSGRPTELDGQLLSYADLRPTEDAALDPREPDRELRLDLQMDDGGRRWLINGAAFGDHEELELASDERVRLVLRNASMMFHPMHVHGHTFALAAGRGPGIRKDTVNLLPMEILAVDLQADNPGRWGVHCHNIYHAELGMMTVLSYVG